MRGGRGGEIVRLGGGGVGRETETDVEAKRMREEEGRRKRN
jgi:hypothetical protein